jgi:VWFA-related protein
MNRASLAFLSAAMLIAAAAAADEPSINSVPRTIDVIVTDNHGSHLAGLTQSDFQILEDGKSREIARFAALTHGADGIDAQPGRNVLIVIDETTISLASRRTIVAALKDFASKRVRPTDRVMVVTMAGLGSALPTAWTSNKDDVVKALAQAEQASLGNKSFERRDTERTIQQALDVDKQATIEARTQNAPPMNLITFDTLVQTGRHYADTSRQHAHAQAGAVFEALSFLGNGPGKKIAIIAGGGLSTHPGIDIFQFLENKRQAVLSGTEGGDGAIRGASSANPLSEASLYDLTKEIRDVAQSARDRGVTIYTIDPENSGSSQSAIEQSESATSNSDFVASADMLSGYQLLTATTGGLSIAARGAEALVPIADDLDTHYLLTYTQSLNDKGMLPKTDVKTSRAGARLRFTYTGGPQTKDSEVKDVVVANHTAAQLSNDLHIELRRDEPVADGENKRVKLHVLIPFKSLKLIAKGDQVAGGFAVYISTGDAKGRASAVNRQTHDIHLPADKFQQLTDKMIDFNVDVVLSGGKNQISIGVMDQQSQQTGFAKTAI